MFMYSISTADVASGAIPKQRKLIERSRRNKDKDGKIEREKDSSPLKKAGSLVETKKRNDDGTSNVPHGNEKLKSWREYKNDDKKSDCEEGPNSGKGKRNKFMTSCEVRRAIKLNKK